MPLYLSIKSSISNNASIVKSHFVKLCMGYRHRFTGRASLLQISNRVRLFYIHVIPAGNHEGREFDSMLSSRFAAGFDAY